MTGPHQRLADGCRGQSRQLAVTRWTGRETLALRVAMRLSVRVFAERLGVAAATVFSWERKRQPSPPSLAMQAVLDRALDLADDLTRLRFHCLAQDSPNLVWATEIAPAGPDTPATGCPVCASTDGA